MAMIRLMLRRPNRVSGGMFIYLLIRTALLMAFVAMVTLLINSPRSRDQAVSDPITDGRVQVADILSQQQLVKIGPPEQLTFRRVFDWIENDAAGSRCRRLETLGGRPYLRTNLLDGDKAVCFDTPPLTIDPSEEGSCLVYSFGIGKDWTFDAEMARRGCEVFAFDPTIEEPQEFRQLGIRFFKIGLGDSNRDAVMLHGETALLPTRTLDRWKDLLGHTNRTIHYLKMDIEFAEYYVLHQQLLSADSGGRQVFDSVQQLGLEVHLIGFEGNLNEAMAMYERLESAIEALHQLGFRVLRSWCNRTLRSRQLHYPGVTRPVCSCYELLAARIDEDMWDRSERDAGF